LLTKVKEIQKPLTFINITSETVPLVNRTQYSRFMELYLNFTQDLNSLKADFEKENQELEQTDIVNQYIYLFSAPIHRDITKS
ncbi:MAG: hypothetical protein ACC656_03620, partial [Candidatus Heimdallarchaeota archaeon]